MRENRYRRVLKSYQQTSRDALESVWELLPAVDARIVRLIQKANGATCHELELWTGIRHQTVSAQIRHLVEGGLLEDSGEKRPNETGRPCIVWALAPQSRQVPTGERQATLFT